MSWNATPADGGSPVRHIRADAIARCNASSAFQRAPLADRHVLILGQIANFSATRRQIGCEGARRLVLDVLVKTNQLLPDARVAVIGRTMIEIEFATRDPFALDRTIDVLNDTFEVSGSEDPACVRMAFGGATNVVGEDAVALYEAAEAALAQALPRNVVSDDDSLLVTSYPPAHDLPAAIAADEMVLHYQPKVHLRQQEVASAEALVRWNHPRLGLIPPGQFIPAAEDTRHIGPLTLWTLRQVIADQRRLAAQGRNIPLFLNISGVLLGDQPFVAEACELVRSGGATIGFEITETSVIRDPDTAIANLNTFADIGIRIAIDDYGAGLSSLAYLKRLPARELKIDKLFVTQLTSSNRDPLIVRSTIDLAHALDMEVTAEGVESPAALALLSVMGCDMAQGFLIGRPAPFDALTAGLADGTYLAAHTAARSGSNIKNWRRA